MGCVPDIPENRERCSCPGCPSNPMNDATLHCGHHVWGKHVEQRGCICGICPLYRVYKLEGEYYCENPLA